MAFPSIMLSWATHAEQQPLPICAFCGAKRCNTDIPTCLELNLPQLAAAELNARCTLNHQCLKLSLHTAWAARHSELGTRPHSAKPYSLSLLYLRLHGRDEG